LETADTEPSLSELANTVDLSPHHFHRIFKKITGLTPKAYARGVKERRVALALETGTQSVTEAIYESGYESTGRFYDQTAERLGMKPKTYRAGGAGETIRADVVESWLGPMLVAATSRGICAIRFGDHAADLFAGLRNSFPKADIQEGDAFLADLIDGVLATLDHPAESAELPLDVQATVFQQKVWAALRRIPAGETRTYAEIATEIGSPRAARAVGTACGANPVAVLTPCHRCVRGDGALGGYAWGLERKAQLLENEARHSRQGASESASLKTERHHGQQS
jgi:AraC family transcriptional regulator of adaptative response/methylated-DNA-[protein]-cysteine methyltransferase